RPPISLTSSYMRPPSSARAWRNTGWLCADACSGSDIAHLGITVIDIETVVEELHGALDGVAVDQAGHRMLKAHDLMHGNPFGFELATGNLFNARVAAGLVAHCGDAGNRAADDDAVVELFANRVGQALIVGQLTDRDQIAARLALGQLGHEDIEVVEPISQLGVV